MATFDEALVRLRLGKRVKLPYWERWLAMNRYRTELGFLSNDWKWLTWVPNQYEILTNDWILED